MFEDSFMLRLINWTLDRLIAVFLSSWVTLFLFTRDWRKSATGSVLVAVIATGLWLATGLFVVTYGRPDIWGPFLAWLLLTMYATEVLVVSMGISYLRLSNKREAAVSGLIISVASMAFFMVPWMHLPVLVLKNIFFGFLQ